MAYSTSIPGVPGGPIETSFPVHLLIAPAWRTNVRPGIKARSPRLPVQHETANPRTMAADDARYLFNGSGGRQASWHMTVDDIEAYIGIPLDEVTWQASDGAGPGNYNGMSCELAVKKEIVNSNRRRAQSQKNAAEIMGIIGARLHARPPAKRHHDYAPDKKWCPAQMMNRGEWNRYVDWWNAFNAEEKARMSGGAPVSQPTAPSDEPFRPGAQVRTTANLNVRRGYGLSFPVIATLDPGAVAMIGNDPDNRYMVDRDGYRWINIDFGPDSGWAASNWLEVVVPAPEKPDEEAKPAPTYATPLIVEELYDTDLKKHDTAEGIIAANETDFVFVADVVEAIRDTPRAQYASTSAPDIGPVVAKGERFVVAWLCKAADGTWWYLTPWWSRIRYEDTTRINDAPLLGNDVH